VAFSINTREGLFLVDFFGHENAGEFAEPIKQLLISTDRTSRDPIILDRSQLQSSDTDLVEILEFLLLLERNRDSFSIGQIYLVQNPAAHPEHMRDLLRATASLKSIDCLHVVDELAVALQLATEAR
jgi:hypothetical protein